MKIMNGKFKKIVSTVLGMTMVISLWSGIQLMTKAELQKVLVSIDASSLNWTGVSGFTNATTIPGGSKLTGTGNYGSGIALNPKLDVSSEVSFDLAFKEPSLATNGWFCITLGNDDYVLDAENANGKGLSFLVYRTADAAIQSARDPINRWLDFPFAQDNSFKIVKGIDSWELYLKNSIITSYALVGKVLFSAVPSDAFIDSTAKLGIYICNASGSEANEVALSVTNVTNRTLQKETQNIILEGANSSFEPTSTGDYLVNDIDNGIHATGTANFGTGVASKSLLDVSKEMSFKLNFTQAVPIEGFFAIALAGDGYAFDPENTGGKGVTYLIYQKAEHAIQSAKDSTGRWLDFPAAENNILTIKKGVDAWDLYLQNRVISDHLELIGKVPFTTVSADAFTDNEAKLILYTYNGTAATTAFNITYLTNAVTLKDVPQSQVEEVILDAKASNWTAAGDYVTSDTAGGASMSGTAGYKFGVTYNAKVDVSLRTEFDVKFTQQALTAGNSFIGITFGNDADSFNDAAKGATFLLYKTADAAIQSDKDTVSRWLDFPFSGVNTFKFGKGIDGWELYLKNSIIIDYALIGKIPYTTVSQDIFASDKATLGIYVSDGATPGQEIKFDITNLKHMTTVNGEEQPVIDGYDLATYTLPFWQGDTVYNESLMFVSNEDGSVQQAPLLYLPSEIISVRSSDLKTEYVQGTDWVLENGKLTIPSGSQIPVIAYSAYYPENASASTFETVDGRNILFTEGSYFHTNQIAVTYKHNTPWTGVIPKYSGSNLPGTIAKLTGKQALKIVFYGDSITTGANSSGIVNAEPFEPAWTVMVTDSLKAAYGYDDITAVNTAVGGKASQWGAENVVERVSDHQPDLVVIGFGMNDGNGSAISPSAFKSNIESIIATVRQTSPDAEFLLVSTMLPNPEVVMTRGNQAEYESELLDLAGAGIAVAPVTSIHKHILNFKRYYDMTGNNVNHPNDFMARVYAQAVNAILINKGVSGKVLYPERTFVLPTNDTYWNCANASSVDDGILTLNDSGVAVYTGSRLEGRLAQFNFSATVTEGNWIGFMTRQSDPGSAPWDQAQVYWVIIKKDGSVELLKRKNGAVTTIATGTAGSYIDADGKIELTTMRFGSIDEKDGVRIIFDIGQENVINFVDTAGPIDDLGLFGVLTLNTTTAKVYLGLPGTDKDSELSFGGFGNGKGYLGGIINPEYLEDWTVLKDYAFSGSILINKVHPEEIQTSINIEETIAQIEQPGNLEVVAAIREGMIVPKSVFEALKGKEKALTFKIVDENGNVLYSWTFLGTDITKEIVDVNLSISFDSNDRTDIEQLTNEADLLLLSFVQQGLLPGKASLHIDINDRFENADNLKLYFYDKNNSSITLMNKDVLVDENGYVDFSITHAATYFLTNSIKDMAVDPLSPETGDQTTTAMLLLVLSFVCGASIVLLNTKKLTKRKSKG